MVARLHACEFGFEGHRGAAQAAGQAFDLAGPEPQTAAVFGFERAGQSAEDEGTVGGGRRGAEVAGKGR